MKVLVTGGSGFLGRHIVQSVEEEGHQVFAPRSKNFNLVTGEGVSETFDSIIKEHGTIDAVIHSAAYYGGIGIIQEEPANVLTINCRMGMTIFEACTKYNIKKVVPVGSACAYPGYLDGDLEEKHFWDGPLHESVEAYGFTKKVLQVAQNAYYKQHKIESVHLILTNLYGPHDVFQEYRSHVVSALIKKFTDAKDKVTLWGDGSPIREFLYVKDASDAIAKALNASHDPLPINIGTGIGTSIKELAELTQKYTKFNGVVEWDTTKPNGTARKVLNVTRQKEKLNWSPKYSLEEGLKETINWYLPNKKSADERP